MKPIRELVSIALALFIVFMVCAGMGLILTFVAMVAVVTVGMVFTAPLPYFTIATMVFAATTVALFIVVAIRYISSFMEPERIEPQSDVPDLVPEE